MTASRHAPGVPSDASIQHARTTIEPFVYHTPMVPAFEIDRDLGTHLLCKAENLQRTGSFKIRGALYCVSRLVDSGYRGPVVAASAGNHAQGVAFAARQFGLDCTIVMPKGASLAKITATQRLGANVLLEGETFDAALEAALALAAERDWQVIPAFDDERIVTGQATLGAEIVDDVPDVSLVLVPVGGGGLAAGVASIVKRRAPQARIVGVQASANPSYTAAVAAGRPVRIPGAQSIADGIAVKQVGYLTFSILERLLDDCVVVHEDEIVTAMALLLERSKLVVEGAGAASVAAVLADRVALPAGPIVAILSGGNVDINLVARVIHYGLTRAGRYLFLRTRVIDRPGALQRLLGVLAGLGANVLDVSHHRQGLLLPVDEVQVEMTVETRDREHSAEILRALRREGYAVQADSGSAAIPSGDASPE